MIFQMMKLLLSPGHLNVICRDWLRLGSARSDDFSHLKATMGWLVRAHEAAGGEGVSAGYDMRRGWLPPYPETTGYIIETFLDYYHLTQDQGFLTRAVRMGEWETKIQFPSGAVRGGIGINSYPIVFNTGQVILGWLALYEETKDRRFLSAAARAGDWLVKVQDRDGKWSKFTYNKIPHTYHSRVAWPLFWLSKVTGTSKYETAAKKNIQWILSQVKDNGWIGGMEFAEGEDPFTHTIAYTLRGLLESSYYIKEKNLKKRAREVVYRAAERLMHFYERRKHNPYAMPLYLPATVDDKWKSKDKYSCLTGNAQLAIVWMKLYKLNNDARLLNSALKILDQVKSTQALANPNPGIQGGIAGSYPIYGAYMRFTYPNWAAKFFADAIMLQEDIMAGLQKP